MLTGHRPQAGLQELRQGGLKGVVKVMSKMGISTVQSYRGAQVFEAIGLRQDVIDEYFTWTPSRVGGIGLDVIAQEVLLRHDRAFPAVAAIGHTLPVGRPVPVPRRRRVPPVQPETIHKLQKAACARGNYATFKEYSRAGQRPGDEPVHAARPAGLQAAAARSRSRRSSRSKRS